MTWGNTEEECGESGCVGVADWRVGSVYEARKVSGEGRIPMSDGLVAGLRSLSHTPHGTHDLNLKNALLKGTARSAVAGNGRACSLPAGSG